MRTTIRLTLKTLRFEIVSMTIAVVLLGLATLYVAWQLDSVHMPVDCLYSDFGIVSAPIFNQAHEDACQPLRQAFYELSNSGGQVFALGVLIPAVSGLLIGVPLVSRELESGSASLAWTLSRSRRRWYYRRVVPLGLIVLAILAVPSIATVVLETSKEPGISPWVSFIDGSLRGPVIALRGLMAMGIGVLVGAVIGRQLPTVIVGGLAVILVTAFVPGLMERYIRDQAVWMPGSGRGDYVIGQGFRNLATGEIVDPGEIYNLAPLDADGNPDQAWFDAHYQQQVLAMPGARYPEIVALECVILGTAAAGAIVLGGLVVDRRRPT